MFACCFDDLSRVLSEARRSASCHPTTPPAAPPNAASSTPIYARRVCQPAKLYACPHSANEPGGARGLQLDLSAWNVPNSISHQPETSGSTSFRCFDFRDEFPGLLMARNCRVSTPASSGWAKEPFLACFPDVELAGDAGSPVPRHDPAASPSHSNGVRAGLTIAPGSAP